MTALVNCARTTVTTPPSPASSGTTLVVPKITLPAVPFKFTVAPLTEAATQENSEVGEATAAVEETLEGGKVWKLTIVRKVEGPMGARAILKGDIFEASVTAASLNPGPWQDVTFVNEPHCVNNNSTHLQIRLEQNGTVARFKGACETGGVAGATLKTGENMFEIPAAMSPGRIVRLPMGYNTSGGGLGEGNRYGSNQINVACNFAGTLWHLVFFLPGATEPAESGIIPPNTDISFENQSYAVL